MMAFSIEIRAELTWRCPRTVTPHGTIVDLPLLDSDDWEDRSVDGERAYRDLQSARPDAQAVAVYLREYGPFELLGEPQIDVRAWLADRQPFLDIEASRTRTAEILSRFDVLDETGAPIPGAKQSYENKVGATRTTQHYAAPSFNLAAHADLRLEWVQDARDAAPRVVGRPTNLISLLWLVAAQRLTHSGLFVGDCRNLKCRRLVDRDPRDGNSMRRLYHTASDKSDTSPNACAAAVTRAKGDPAIDRFPELYHPRNVKLTEPQRRELAEARLRAVERNMRPADE